MGDLSKIPPLDLLRLMVLVPDRAHLYRAAFCEHLIVREEN